ncbi:MAG: diacylglycerol kinase family lipid kinase [Clostridia bacterium]|nr:diacylglycerol kinase family lipid kinase [Clostridia bacterium]
MARFYFIVNPVAGGGRTLSAFEKVQQALNEREIDYAVAYTPGPFTATELARDALDNGERCIVAVGGDGTMNEVAAALIGSDATMGMLPFGTGNDLARVLGLPTEPMAALSVLLKGQTRLMDTGRANERVFLNVAGIGFDVDGLLATLKYKHRFRGMFPYMLGIFDALTHMRTLHMTFEANGETFREDTLLMGVGNGQYFGGGMRAVPTADPFDGLFDVYIVRKVGIFRFLTLLPSFVKGKHAQKACVRHFRTTDIRISCPEDCMLDIDGEVTEHTPARFTLLPASLRLLCTDRAGD